MVKKLFFELSGKVFHFRCHDYRLENGFYIFTDIIDGKTRKLHESLFRGEENV